MKTLSISLFAILSLLLFGCGEKVDPNDGTKPPGDYQAIVNALGPNGLLLAEGIISFTVEP